MRIGKSVAMLMVLALVGMAVPMIGMADNLSAKTVLTFSQPVEIPGVVLPAGTYVFKFDDVKDLAQVWDVEENRIYTTVMTTVSYVPEPPDGSHPWRKGCFSASGPDGHNRGEPEH